jgi:hypothetical protein
VGKDRHRGKRKGTEEMFRRRDVMGGNSGRGGRASRAEEREQKARKRKGEKRGGKRGGRSIIIFSQKTRERERERPWFRP